MKRLLFFAALVAAAISVVAGSAIAAGNKTSVIFDSSAVNGPPSNLPSVGAESSAFAYLGDQVTFATGPRKLSNVAVTVSSFACVSGHWDGVGGLCSTPSGATFSLPMTLNIYDATGTNLLASSSQTFDVPYRPSASSQCLGGTRWFQAGSKGGCYNGLANTVTFNFSGNVTLPDTVVYQISYNTSHHGPSPIGDGQACSGTVAGCPYDSLNIALNDTPPVSVGTDVISGDVWQDGIPFTGYDDHYTPAVQFKAGGGS
jgi:hypothetical protein